MLQIKMLSDEIEDGLTEYDEQDEHDENNSDPKRVSPTVIVGPEWKFLKHSPYRQCAGYDDTEDLEEPIERLTPPSRHRTSPLPFRSCECLPYAVCKARPSLH